MAVDNQTLYKALKELQVIPDKQLDAVFAESVAQKRSLGDLVVEKDLIKETDLGELTADILSVPFIKLTTITIPKEVLLIISETLARQKQIIAFKKDKEGLHVAMANPADVETIDFLKNKTGLPILRYGATKRDIQQAFALYLKDIDKAFAEVIQANIEEAKNNRQDIEPPIIKIVETIISYGYENNASDIHLEPEEKSCLVRFRIDGVLHDIISLSLDLYPQIVTRVKVLANLRTDEHQVPQDGKIEFAMDGQKLDIRVSIVPVRKGEAIVMRLLSERARKISLESLGFSESDLQKVKRAYQKPYGMILSTGPTGCGKTTTMYAVLKLLNTRDVNIMTIEDPIEYDVEGVNQIQVNTKANLTFASGLRSILRQDPNIILVGEIRDEETAGIATNAAMTGHLVLSTLHTNDAATALPRLLDMNIEPFIISSTANVIIAQRLVRKIHGICRISLDVSMNSVAKYVDKSALEKIFGDKDTMRIYRGKGCALCHNTRYEERMGIFEVMEISEEIKQAIVAKKDAATIKALAVKQGMKTMIEDGLEKVRLGETTIDEVLRVTKE